jgi:hypothetical protein
MSFQPANPATFTYRLQRNEALLADIADWCASTGAERGRDRRCALRLLAAERARRNAGRAELRTAANRAATVLKAAA